MSVRCFVGGLPYEATDSEIRIALASRGIDQRRLSWYMLLFQLPAVPESLVARTLAKSLRDSGLPDEYVNRYAAAMSEPGALTGALNWYRGIPFALRPPLGRITVPTSLIWGSNDPALARTSVELTADYVAGPYELVELDAGHWLPETEPDAVAAGILARVRSAPAPTP